MENNIRFRNHASVILENSLKSIGTVFFIFVINFASEIGEIRETEMDLGGLLFLIGVLIVVLAIVIGYQAIIWAKTYITVEENTLVVERNTLNKKRNTIGLKNISNVNLEQNVLEMILGTCKVKLDTNSLSTADQTDVNIVLKKIDAERFRQLVLGRVEGQDVIFETEEVIGEEKKHIADIGDIILHGLFSIRIFSALMLVALVYIEGWMFAEEGPEILGENPLEIIMSLFVAFWFIGGILWSMIKEFIKYIGFVIERKKDKVYLNYGILKRVAYSVPVDKINGIRLIQTPLARMGRRYMVEIINVGMDDDENETNTFFLPYAKKEKIVEQLHLLLPEFDGCIEIQEKRQSKSIWIIWLPRVLFFVLCATLGCGIAAEFEPEMVEPVLWAAVVMGIWFLILKVAGFITKGVAVDSQFLKIVDGGFAKRMLFVKYDKIQYVTGKQCVIAKHFKIQKGTISLLASLKNRIHELPYFKENDMEQLKKFLV